jgi:hypothetical protein
MIYVYGHAEATAKGTATVRVVCEKCRHEYFYNVTATARGMGHSPSMVDNEGAQRRAREHAAKALSWRLRHAVEPVSPESSCSQRLSVGLSCCWSASRSSATEGISNATPADRAQRSAVSPCTARHIFGFSAKMSRPRCVTRLSVVARTSMVRRTRPGVRHPYAEACPRPPPSITPRSPERKS